MATTHTPEAQLEAIRRALQADRVRRGISKRGLARLAGIHYDRITEFEAGKVPNALTLFRMASALGVEIRGVRP